MTTSSDTSLEVENLTVHYDSTPALWDISLSIPTGKLVGIVGPNGAGKSTLNKAGLQLIPSSSGRISFFNQPLEQVRKRIAYVPQKESVDWDFPITVEQLVLMGRYGQLKLAQRPRACDFEAVEAVLVQVGLLSLKDRQISQLSGGQQQRAFLARALLQEADLYFMDEPFVGIDQTTEKILIEILMKMKEAKKTVFIVHHDLGTVRSTFDWAIMLNMHLIKAGPLEEVFTKENLKKAYGQQYNLLDEALKLSSEMQRGR